MRDWFSTSQTLIKISKKSVIFMGIFQYLTHGNREAEIDAL